MFDPTAFAQNTLNTIYNHKMAGFVYETFAPGVRVHRSCQEPLYGQEALMIEIVERLAAIPDLKLKFENIIAQRSTEDAARVSIRLTLSGHNLGVSRYGAPTQQPVEQGILLNGHIVHGRFVELWIAEDERSLVQQIGYELPEALEALDAMEAFVGKAILEEVPAAMGEMQRRDAPLLSTSRLENIQLDSTEALRTVLDALWNERQIGICAQSYDEAFACHWASNRVLEGREAYQALVLSHLAAFPDLVFHVDEMIEQQREDGWHIASGWTMLGTHTGPSIYGFPTGKRVKINGISQYLIREGRIVSERSEWNEFRLMRQIMTTAGSEAKRKQPEEMDHE